MTGSDIGLDGVGPAWLGSSLRTAPQHFDPGIHLASDPLGESAESFLEPRVHGCLGINHQHSALGDKVKGWIDRKIKDRQVLQRRGFEAGLLAASLQQQGRGALDAFHHRLRPASFLTESDHRREQIGQLHGCATGILDVDAR